MNPLDTGDTANPVEGRVPAAIQRILPETEAVRQQNEYPFPFSYDIHSKGKIITAFAAKHSFDPEEPMFQKLRQKFNAAHPSIVIIEGVAELEKEFEKLREYVMGHSDEEVITECGEPIFMLKLALEKGVEVISPEFNNRQELEMFLKNGASPEHIFAYYFFQKLNGLGRMGWNKVQIEERMRSGLAGFKKFTGWDDFDFSYEHAERLAVALWGEPINFSPGFYNERTCHWGKEILKEKYSPVNDVSAILNKARDQNIVTEAARALATHDRVMIVYGGSHMVQIRPALEYLVFG